MFENVLIGVDGRPGGRDALALARQLAGAGAKLTAVHAYESPLATPRIGRPSEAAVRERRASSQALLERELRESGLDAQELSVEEMPPGRALHEQAERVGAELIVVGSCSRGLFGRAMLGDDARAALNGAPCAVAVASHGFAEREGRLARIGVGYNGSPESEIALDLARRLAAREGATPQALDVVSLTSYAYTGLLAVPLGESIEIELRDANERLSQLPEASGRAVCGVAGEELAAFSAELDLLVVGSRGYGPLRRLVLGSTSGYLAGRARCSLLVLPRGAGKPTVPDEGGEAEGAQTAGAGSR